MQFENESEYPKSEDFMCPPAESIPAENKTFYKFSDTNILPSEYMEPMIIKGTRPPKNAKEQCFMCGHSVFTNIQDMLDLIEKKRGATKGVENKWKFIFSFEGILRSRYLHTPSRKNKNHYTYWHSGDKITDDKYEYVGDIESLK